MQLSQFNSLAPADAFARVQVCADIPRWSQAVVAGRPHATRDELLASARDLANSWTRDEVAAALADHPRIGERRDTDDEQARLSQREQGTSDPDAATAAALREGNLAYEQRFHRVFLIRAAGRTREQMLADLTRRLAHDDDAEWAETTRNLQEIALLRLSDLVEETA